MKVELRNIGPINHAEIDLEGLAVLVGPNASGKTTLSTACYASLLSFRIAEQSAYRHLLDRFSSVQRKADPIPTSRGLGEQFASAFRASLATEFERCFSPDLAKLPRRGRGGAGSAPRVIVSGTLGADDNWQLVLKISEGSLVLEPRHPSFALPRFDTALGEARQSASLVMRRRSLSRRGTNPVYFPAARSGYVQMQSVLASLLLAALGRGYFNQVALGKISGVAADFLEFLAGLDPTSESGLPTDAVARLEAQLLHGQIRLLSTGDSAKQIEFAPDGVAEYWPMDAAATSIAELAPLVLYLRHRVRRNDLLFIDEPEAHLHPANQLVLADVLLDLSTRIAGMVVGTHSDFFVTGISNGLLRRNRGDTTDVADVSLYELNPSTGSTGGFDATRIEIATDAGFEVGQFSEVAEAAIDEAQTLFQLSHGDAE